MSRFGLIPERRGGGAARPEGDVVGARDAPPTQPIRGSRLSTSSPVAARPVGACPSRRYRRAQCVDVIGAVVAAPVDEERGGARHATFVGAGDVFADARCILATVEL